MPRAIDLILIASVVLVGCLKNYDAESKSDALFEKTVAAAQGPEIRARQARALFVQLEATLSTNNCKNVLKIICLPLNSRDAIGNVIVIRNDKEFCREFERIFSPKIRKLLSESIAKNSIEGTSKGYSVGRGEIWVGEKEGGMCIFSIIPDLDVAIRNRHRIDDDERDRNP